MIKVLVIGAGAIGAFYGSLLTKAETEVSVVCRSDYDQVKQHGFIIMPPHETSMLLDYESGHPMKAEAIPNNAPRAARRLGIAAPHLEQSVS